MLAYLRPHGFVHFHSLVPGFLLLRAEHSPPAAVPVVIDYNVHISVQRPCNYFVNTGHKALVNGVISAFKVHAVCPCYRNSYGIKSGCFHSLDHFLGGSGLTPAGFKRCRAGAAQIALVVVSLQGVAEINSVSHSTDNFKGSHGVFLRRGCSFLRCRGAFLR